MRVLSWDVGIKNLAYCLIDNENNKIEDWGVINLLEDENRVCHGFINSENNNSVCIKKPQYEFINGNSCYNFCLLHKNQFMKIEKNIVNINTIKTDEKCEVLLSNKKNCTKKACVKIEEGNSTKLCCSFHLKHFDKKNNILRKINKTNVNKTKIEDVKLNLINALDKKNFQDIDYVLIENQPSLKNPKMKSIAETLYSWFLIRGIVDKKVNNLKDIFYLSPSNKLKIDDVDLNKEIDKLNDTSKKYKFTKQSSVTHTKNLISDEFNNDWVSFLESSSKKDDLCDSFLQGIYFIKNEKKFI